MAVTCDGLLPEGPCGRPATTTLTATVRDRTIAMDLCTRCAEGIEAYLIRAGGKVVGASVGYKPRAAYVAKSGLSFTAEEARSWLVDQGLAQARGRLSKKQLETYADAH